MAKLTSNFAFVSSVDSVSVDPVSSTAIASFSAQLVCVTGPIMGAETLTLTTQPFTLSLNALSTAIVAAINTQFGIDFPDQTIAAGAHVIPSFQTA